MTDTSDQTTVLHGLVQRSNQGDAQAREQLIDMSYQRLRRILRRKMWRSDRIKRWEETDDVLQQSVLKLYQSLDEVKPANLRAYLGLAAEQMRRTLIDLSRHYYGRQGLGANHATDQLRAGPDGNREFDPPANETTNNPARLADWTEFHEQVNDLPPDEREVFDLIWYHGLGQEEAAGVLGISTRTLRRHFRSAKLHLHKSLGGALPGEVTRD